MGLKEAKEYIDKLHKRQDNPLLWPDYLTGLPDKAAIIKKISTAYAKGKDCIIYARIANIQPYLIKYGPDRHAELIQWAAAILKTTAERHKAFVGVFNSHDFIAVCEKTRAEDLIDEASMAFDKKARTFYSEEDIKKGRVISFVGDGKRVSVGLMRLISSSVCGNTDIPREHIIQHLGSLCDKLERAESFSGKG